MSRFLETISELDIVKGKKSFTEEERLWLVSCILILSEKAGLTTFVRDPLKDKRREVPLPRGLIKLLEACEKQGLITINRKKLLSRKKQ